MNLGVDREPAVVEPLDHVGLPERAVPIEQAAVQARGEFEEFAHTARGRQRRPAQVVFEVQFVVERPRDVGDAAEQFRGMLAERRTHVVAVDEALIEVADVLRPGILGRLEQLQSADMHGVLTRLGE